MKRVLVSIALMTLLLAGNAAAADLTFILNTIFDGPGNFAGNITAEFTQNGSNVDLVLSNTSNGDVKDWGFNYAPWSAPLTITPPSPQGTVTYAITQGEDHWQADGDGKYDIRFEFESAAAARFTPGKVLTFSIANALVASFNAYSAPGGGNGPFLTAAHVISTPNGSSNFVTTPEPGFYGLLSLGLGGLLLVFRRRKSA